MLGKWQSIKVLGLCHNNEEKYISFSKEIVLCHITDEEGGKLLKREIRFIDSFRFIPTSLDALIKNLDTEQCKNLKKFYSDPRKFELSTIT